MKALKRSVTRTLQCARRLRDDTSAIALVEFALSLPILTTLGMFGMEVAYMASTSMQVSQIALSLADNASRLQQTANTTIAPTVSESDVDTIMAGARYEGRQIGLATFGRVILSSLERDPATGRQFFHWQRCTGSLAVQSSYGNDSTLNGLGARALPTIGNSTTPITAQANMAVMIVEIYYTYPGLFGTMFLKQPRIRQEATYVVRDSRDLRPTNQPGLVGSTSNSRCT